MSTYETIEVHQRNLWPLVKQLQSNDRGLGDEHSLVVFQQCCCLERTPVQNRFLIYYSFNCAVRLSSIEAHEHAVNWMRECFRLAKEVGGQDEIIAKASLFLARENYELKNWQKVSDFLMLIPETSLAPDTWPMALSAKVNRGKCFELKPFLQKILEKYGDSLASIQQIVCILQDDRPDLIDLAFEHAFDNIKEPGENARLFVFALSHSATKKIEKFEGILNAFIQWLSHTKFPGTVVDSDTKSQFLKLSEYYINILGAAKKWKEVSQSCEAIVFACMILDANECKSFFLAKWIKAAIQEGDIIGAEKIIELHKVTRKNPFAKPLFLQIALLKGDKETSKSLIKCASSSVQEDYEDLIKVFMEFVRKNSTHDLTDMEFIIDILNHITDIKDFRQKQSEFCLVCIISIQINLTLLKEFEQRGEGDFEKIRENLKSLIAKVMLNPTQYVPGDLLFPIAWNMALKTKDVNERFIWLAYAANFTDKNSSERLVCRMLELASIVELMDLADEKPDMDHKKIKEIIQDCDRLMTKTCPQNLQQKRLLTCYKFKLATMMDSVETGIRDLLLEVIRDSTVDHLTLLILVECAGSWCPDLQVEALFVSAKSAQASDCSAEEVATIYLKLLTLVLLVNSTEKLKVVKSFTEFLRQLEFKDIPQEIVYEMIVVLWNYGIYTFLNHDLGRDEEALNLCEQLVNFTPKYSMEIEAKLSLVKETFFTT